MRAAREYKKNTKGGEEEKNYSLKFKNERDFLHLLLIGHYDNGKMSFLLIRKCEMRSLKQNIFSDCKQVST